MRKGIFLFLLASLAAIPAHAAKPNFSYTYIDVQSRTDHLRSSKGSGQTLEASYAFHNNFFAGFTLSKDRIDLYIHVQRASADFSADYYTYDNPPVFAYGPIFDVYNYDNYANTNEQDVRLFVGGAWPISGTTDMSIQFYYVNGSVGYSLSGTYTYVGSFALASVYNNLPTGTPVSPIQINSFSGDGRVPGPYVLDPGGSFCVLDPSYCRKDTLTGTGAGLKIGMRSALTDNLEMFGTLWAQSTDPFDDAIASRDFRRDNWGVSLGARYAITDHLALSLSTDKNGGFKTTNVALRVGF